MALKISVFMTSMIMKIIYRQRDSKKNMEWKLLMSGKYSEKEL